MSEVLARIDVALLNDELTFTLMLLAALAMVLASWPQREVPRGP